MKPTTLSIRKSIFFLLIGVLILLSAFVFFLFRDKQVVQQQNRQLIIQNDSILSVNIVLADSIKQKEVSSAIQNPSLSKAGEDE